METCGGCSAKGCFVETREDGLVCIECGWIPQGEALIGAYNKFAKGNTVFHDMKDDNKYKTTRKRMREEEEECLPAEAFQGDPDVKESMETTYRRIFHFNERLTQLNLCEPGIPLELFKLIVETYSKKLKEQRGSTPVPDELTKEDVKRLCNEIEIPYELQEKYRSKKFKKNPHNDMRRYAEKWMSIRARLGGYRPPKLETHQVKEIRELFCEAEGAFKRIRHKEGCTGEKDCHKSPSACRHNFLNYNYVILQLLNRMGLNEVYAPWLPQLKTKDKLDNLNKYWEMMCKELGWEFDKIILVDPDKENELPKEGWERAIPVPLQQMFTKDPDFTQEDHELVVENWLGTFQKPLFKTITNS